MTSTANTRNASPDFDLNINNYNFNELLTLFKIHDIALTIKNTTNTKWMKN